MRGTTFLFSCASLFCASCGEPGEKATRGLVGGRQVAAKGDLVRGSFYIVRGGGPDGGNSLTYDWRSDGTLIVEHTFSDGKGGRETKGKDTLEMSAEASARARHLLARLLPERPEGLEQDARPSGCARQGPHDAAEVTVAFIDPGQLPGNEDDEVGVFALPRPDSCDTPAAVEARRVVRHVLQLFPQSSVTEAFERLS